MFRRFGSLLAYLSIIVCASFLALYIRSFWSWDVISYGNRALDRPQAGPYVGSIASGLGLLMFEADRVPDRRTWFDRMFVFYEWTHGWSFRGFPLNKYSWPQWIDDSTFYGRLGFHVGDQHMPQWDVWRMSFPHWVLCVIAFIPPVMYVRRAGLQSRRRAAGLCSACGYDVRATPERCPECGAVVEHATPPPPKSRFTPAHVWLAAGIVAIVIGAAQETENNVGGKRIEEWKQKQQQVRSGEAQTLEEVERYFKASMPRSRLPSRQVAESLARSGVWGSKVGPREDPLYEDPRTHAVVRLNVLGDAWAAFQLLPRDVPEPGMWVWKIRYGIIAACYLAAWVLLIRLLVRPRGARAITAHLLCALIGLGFVLCLLSTVSATPGSV